ncbi:hypothetical protein MOP88_03460 [Sphingomonas sp. WKB10]|nr:hypothetical protein [Sphingomonas sp. WKB10]
MRSAMMRATIVLRLTGAALTQPWLRDCFAARIGGDEFALIVTAPALIADPDGCAAAWTPRCASPSPRTASR